jgi:rod shape determining protein RodA
MATSPIVDPTDERQRRPTSSLPTAGLLRIDPILLLAVLGLGACSIMAIGETRFSELVSRQGVYFGVGLLFALVISQIDYSRLRELKWGLYGLMLVAILAVLALGGVTRGSRRALQLGFAELQASEFGKVLLALVLAAFLVDRARQLRDRDTTARAMLLALVPTALVLATDLG